MVFLEKLWQMAADAGIPIEQLRSPDGVTVTYVLGAGATPAQYTQMDTWIADPDNLKNLLEETYGLSKEQLISKALNRIAFLEGPGVGDTAWSAMSAADQDQMMEWMRQESVFFYRGILVIAGYYE